METKHSSKRVINNDFYHELHEKWYQATDHPIALLRAENRLRVPWVEEEINTHFQGKTISLLDVGCGAGFLTQALSKKGHQVTGIDLSASSIDIAREATKSDNLKHPPSYLVADALNPPFPSDSFDVITAMDILEHVQQPERLIDAASRLLKPGGLFFFHTFNRNPLSYLMVIKGVEWFVKNTPQNMHVYHLFLKPEELKVMLAKYRLRINSLRGLRPTIFQKPLFKLLLKGEVDEAFSFSFSRRCLTGYCGIAEKI